MTPLPPYGHNTPPAGVPISDSVLNKLVEIGQQVATTAEKVDSCAEQVREHGEKLDRLIGVQTRQENLERRVGAVETKVTAANGWRGKLIGIGIGIIATCTVGGAVFELVKFFHKFG